MLEFPSMKITMERNLCALSLIVLFALLGLLVNIITIAFLCFSQVVVSFSPLQEGLGYEQVSIDKNGRRNGAYQAYLKVRLRSMRALVLSEVASSRSCIVPISPFALVLTLPASSMFWSCLVLYYYCLFLPSN